MTAVESGGGMGVGAIALGVGAVIAVGGFMWISGSGSDKEKKGGLGGLGDLLHGPRSGATTNPDGTHTAYVSYGGLTATRPYTAHEEAERKVVDKKIELYTASGELEMKDGKAVSASTRAFLDLFDPNGFVRQIVTGKKEMPKKVTVKEEVDPRLVVQKDREEPNKNSVACLLGMCKKPTPVKPTPPTPHADEQKKVLDTGKSLSGNPVFQDSTGIWRSTRTSAAYFGGLFTKDGHYIFADKKPKFAADMPAHTPSTGTVKLSDPADSRPEPRISSTDTSEMGINPYNSHTNFF